MALEGEEGEEERRRGEEGDGRSRKGFGLRRTGDVRDLDGWGGALWIRIEMMRRNVPPTPGMWEVEMIDICSAWCPGGKTDNWDATRGQGQLSGLTSWTGKDGMASDTWEKDRVVD